MAAGAGAELTSSKRSRMNCSALGHSALRLRQHVNVRRDAEGTYESSEPAAAAWWSCASAAGEHVTWGGECSAGIPDVMLAVGVRLGRAGGLQRR